MENQMEINKHIEHTLIPFGKVLEKILDEIEENENIVYNIWKDNKIIAKLISYKKYEEKN